MITRKPHPNFARMGRSCYSYLNDRFLGLCRTLRGDVWLRAGDGFQHLLHFFLGAGSVGD